MNRTQRKRAEKASTRFSKLAMDRLDRLEAHVETLAKPEARKSDPGRNPFEKLADYLERTPLTRLAFVVGTYFIIISLFGFWQDMRARDEERVSRAWQSLSFPATGNSGKAEALEFLHSRGERFVGINLGGTSKSNGTYVDGLSLEKADFFRPILNYGELHNLVFSEVRLIWAKANNAVFRGNFQKTRFVWSELVGTVFNAVGESSISFHNSLADKLFFHPDFPTDVSAQVAAKVKNEDARPQLRFNSTSLRCALLAFIPMTHFEFEDVDISGAYFNFYPHENDESHNKSWANLKGAWYYTDNPPVGLPADKMRQYLVARDRAQVADICKKHEPRAFEDDPLGKLDGPDGIEIACVSLARMPDKCQPYSPNARINSLWHSPQEYGLQNKNEPQ